MSSVRKLPVTEAMDKHHCLACDIIVQGLDRYILHKRQDCPALQLVRSTNNGASTAVGEIPHKETQTEERSFSLAANTDTDCWQGNVTDSLDKESTMNSGLSTSCGTIPNRDTSSEERSFSLAANKVADCLQGTDSPEKESTKTSISTPSGTIPHRETRTEERSFSLAASTAADCSQGPDSPENESTKNSVRILCGAIPHGETPAKERPSSPGVNAATDCMQDIVRQEMGNKEISAVEVHVAGTGCLRISSHATSGLSEALDFPDLHHKAPSTRVVTDATAKQCTDTSTTEGCLNGDMTSSRESSQEKVCGEANNDKPTDMEVPSSSCAVGEPPTSLMEWESSTTGQTSEATNEALDPIIETKPQADKNETLQTTKQHYCSVCKRTFLSAAGLSRHFSSRRHKSISSQPPSVSDSSLKSSCSESPSTDGNSSSVSLGVNESESFKANFSATSADKAPTTRITYDENKGAFKRKRWKRNRLNYTTGMAGPIEHENDCHDPSKAEHGNKDDSMESTDKDAEEQEMQNKGNNLISGAKNFDEKLDVITEEDRSTHSKVGCSKVKNNSRRKGRPRQCQKSDSEEKNNSKQHSCSECSFKSTYKASLRRHLEASHKLYLCSSCNQTFVTSEEYSTHQRGVHGTSTKMRRAGLECSDCDAQFSTEDDINVHRREARHMLYMGSTCVFCGKTVSNVTCLRAHIQAVHLGEKPHKCQYCPYSTAWATDLRMHVKRHLGIKAFKCPECDYTAVRMEAVKKHQQTHREGEPRTLCEICGKSFAGNLQRHMKLHEGLKPFVCPHEGCTYASTYKQGLDVHIRSVHLADKSILCEECGFATTTDKLMKWHKRRKHSGEKPHKCDQCSYATTWRPHLIRHKRTHTGEKPYKCQHCSYSANNVENLRKHILKTKKHQGLQQYICRWCPYTTNSQHDFSHHLRNEHPAEDLGITPTFVLGINRGVVKMRSVRSQDKLGQLAAEVHDNTGSMEVVGALPGIALPLDRLQNDDERE